MKKQNKVLGIIALMMGLIGTMAVPAAAASTSSIAPVAASGAIPTDGTGTVIENSTDTPEKREFFTIKTPAGNVFYIVVDKQKTSDNVYLLTPVTESDLAKLAGSKTADTITGNTISGQGQTVVGSSPVSQAPATSSPSTVSQTPKTSAAAKAVTSTKTLPSGGNAATVAIAVLAILVAGGARFYFKIYKPRHEVNDMEDDVEEAEEKSPDTEAGTPDENERDEGGSDSDSKDGDE